MSSAELSPSPRRYSNDNFKDHDIQFVKASDIHKLRYTILFCDTGAWEKVYFVGDDDADTLHIALYIEGEIASFISLMHEVRPHLDETTTSTSPVYRLRGVSTVLSHRGNGYATLLIRYALNHLQVNLNARRMWFYARLNALSMYEKMGFRYSSDVFDIPPVGPHREMCLELQPSPED